MIWKKAIVLLWIPLIISCSDFLADYIAVKFVAVSFMGKWSYAAELDDWSTMTAHPNPAYEHVCFSQEGSNERFVAIGVQVTVSLNGRRIDYTGGSPGSPMYDIVYANGIFVTVGGGGDRAVSADGINWTSSDEGNGLAYSGLAYGNGYFLAVGTSGKSCRTTDGQNWGIIIDINGADNRHYNAATYVDGIFMAVGNNTIAYSTDNGTSWNAYITLEVLHGVAYGNGMFMAVGENGYCRYGDLTGFINGQSFFLGSDRLNDIIYSHGQFIAVGNTNRIYYDITPTGSKHVETDVSSGYVSITGNY